MNDIFGDIFYGQHRIPISEVLRKLEDQPDYLEITTQDFCDLMEEIIEEQEIAPIPGMPS